MAASSSTAWSRRTPTRSRASGRRLGAGRDLGLAHGADRAAVGAGSQVGGGQVHIAAVDRHGDGGGAVGRLDDAGDLADLLALGVLDGRAGAVGEPATAVVSVAGGAVALGGAGVAGTVVLGGAGGLAGVAEAGGFTSVEGAGGGVCAWARPAARLSAAPVRKKRIIGFVLLFPRPLSRCTTGAAKPRFRPRSPARRRNGRFPA